MSTPNVAASNLLHHIVGNGHRAQRHAKMNPAGYDQKYSYVKAYPEDGPKEGEHLPITDDEIQEHIDGLATYATVIIGADGLVSAACIELDADALEGAGRVLVAAEKRGFTAFSIAVKGAGDHDGSHTWLLFAERVKPANAAHLARQIATEAGYPDCEIWPKGNAIRLPFGIHTHTQQRGKLLLQSGLVYYLDDPADLDAGARVVAALPLNAAPSEPPKVERVKPSVTRLNQADSIKLNGGPSPIEQFNASHDIEDLLEQYGATRTKDGAWSCNCGVEHTHENNLAATSQGKLVSYSDRCKWAPQWDSGKCTDAFGLYCIVEHSGNVKAAVAALLPEPEPAPNVTFVTAAQKEARRKDAERKRLARQRQAAELRADVMGRAATDPDMPEQALQLLDIHLTIAGQRKWHKASVARMAEMAGYGERWVQRYNQYLIDQGYITREQPDPTHTAIWTFAKNDTQRNSTPQTTDDRVIAESGANDERSPVLDLERDLKNKPDQACEPPPPPTRAQADSLDTWEACEPEHGADELNALDLAANLPQGMPEPAALTSPDSGYSVDCWLYSDGSVRWRVWNDALDQVISEHFSEADALSLALQLSGQIDLDTPEDEAEALIDSLCGPVPPEQLAQIEQGASYVGEPLIIDNPHAVPSWMRPMGDIAMERKPEAEGDDQAEVVQILHDLADPDPLVRCPPSDPALAQRYYALLGAARKAKSPGQRIALERKADALMEWRPAVEAAGLRGARASQAPRAIGPQLAPKFGTAFGPAQASLFATGYD